MIPNYKIPIFDGHNDSLQRTYLEKRGKGITILDKSDIAQIDLFKMKKGGMIGGFFAIQTPPKNLKERTDEFGFHIDQNGYYVDLPKPLEQKYSEDFVNNVLEYTNQLINNNNDKLKVIRKYKDISLNLENPISILLHLEGAEAIQKDLSNLEDYYNKGIRSIGLCWSRKNVFGTGVQYKFPSTSDIGNGLTQAGKNLIRTCNDLGIIVDLAHINEKGFFDAVKISNKPIVITHTDIYALCHASRNISDDQIDAVGKSNGIIGINFEPITTNPIGLKLNSGLTLDDTFKNLVQTPLSLIVSHIDYIVKRIGLDHVGFGADMDGAIMPLELKDASEFQNIVQALYEYGYDEESIRKICYKNWIRVIKDTIR